MTKYYHRQNIGGCCSIRRNICYGLELEDGVSPDEVPSMADIEEAARLANAHDFIMGLPQGYDTVNPRSSSAAGDVDHAPAAHCLLCLAVVTRPGFAGAAR